MSGTENEDAKSDETPLPPSSSSHPPFPKDAKLSDQLAYLHAVFDHKPMQLRDMIGALGNHAPHLLIILLTLPCMIPLPIPLSPPLGFAIVVVAFALMRGKKPSFSEKVLNTRFPAGVHDKLVRFSKRIVGWIERWLHPGRAAVLLATPARERLHILGLVLSGVYLLLPLPIPFSNTFPAWAILFVASGLLGRDGVFVMIGHAILAAGIFYIIFLGAATATALDSAWKWIAGQF